MNNKVVTKHLFTQISLLVLIIILFLPNVFGQNKKTITLDDIYAKGTFQMAGVSGFTSLNDSRYYCNTDKDDNILRYEFASGNLLDTLLKHTDLVFENTIFLENFLAYLLLFSLF